jgi:ribosomal subunit interface protein
MQLEPQITFRNMGPSPAMETQIRQRLDELNHLFDRITGCRVVVEAAHRHQRKGRIYHVRVDLSVPGNEIVVKRDPPEHHAHEDMHVAIRDAFDAVRRQLEDHVRRSRGLTKTHETGDYGKIARLFPEEGYGFILSTDGEEIYMHRNSVTSEGFDKLRVGDAVRYVVHPGEGEKGPQASTVIVLGKHHPSPQPL